MHLRSGQDLFLKLYSTHWFLSHFQYWSDVNLVDLTSQLVCRGFKIACASRVKLKSRLFACLHEVLLAGLSQRLFSKQAVYSFEVISSSSALTISSKLIFMRNSLMRMVSARSTKLQPTAFFYMFVLLCLKKLFAVFWSEKG